MDFNVAFHIRHATNLPAWRFNSSQYEIRKYIQKVSNKISARWGGEHAVALHTHKVLVLAVVWSSHFLGISSRMNITTMISATAKYELKRKYYAHVVCK